MRAVARTDSTDRAGSTWRRNARVVHEGSFLEEGNAALRVDHDAIPPRVADPAGDDPIPIADFRPPEGIEGRAGRIRGLPLEVQKADFAFQTPYNLRAGRLPVAAEGAAT